MDEYQDFYDVNLDDFDGADYAALSAGAEEMPIDELFRGFSLHRIITDDPFGYGEACE